MKYCESCRVTVQCGLSRCPLCGDILAERGGGEERDFPAHPRAPQERKWAKLLILLSVAAVAAVGLIFGLFSARGASWVGIAFTGVLYLWLSLRYIRKSRRNIGLLALVQVFGISLLSFGIDLLTGYSHWSTNYVIPFVIISAAGLLSAVLALRPRRLHDYILYQIGISVIGILTSVFLLLDRQTVVWTGVVGVVYSGLTILGIVLFIPRKARHELRKRFHF